jgi:hypothetical protein
MCNDGSKADRFPCNNNAVCACKGTGFPKTASGAEFMGCARSGFTDATLQSQYPTTGCAVCASDPWNPICTISGLCRCIESSSSSSAMCACTNTTIYDTNSEAELSLMASGRNVFNCFLVPNATGRIIPTPGHKYNLPASACAACLDPSLGTFPCTSPTFGCSCEVRGYVLEGVNAKYQGCTNVISTGFFPFVTDALCSVCAHGRYTQFPCNDTRACNCSTRIAVNPNVVGSNLVAFIAPVDLGGSSASWTVPLFASVAATAVVATVAFLGVKKYLASKSLQRRPTPQAKEQQFQNNPMFSGGNDVVVIHDDVLAFEPEVQPTYEDIEG